MQRRQPIYFFTPGDALVSRVSRPCHSCSTPLSLLQENKRSRLSASVYVNVFFFLNRAQHCTVHVILDYNNKIMRLIFSDYWTGLIEIQDRRKKGSLFLKICSILKILRLVVTDKRSHSTFLVLTNIRKI